MSGALQVLHWAAPLLPGLGTGLQLLGAWPAGSQKAPQAPGGLPSMARKLGTALGCPTAASPDLAVEKWLAQLSSFSLGGISEREVLLPRPL